MDWLGLVLATIRSHRWRVIFPVSSFYRLNHLTFASVEVDITLYRKDRDHQIAASFSRSECRKERLRAGGPQRVVNSYCLGSFIETSMKLGGSSQDLI